MLVKINGIPIVQQALEQFGDVNNIISKIETCSVHNYCVDQVTVWNNSPADYVNYMVDSMSSVDGIKHMFADRVNEVASVGHFIHGVVSQLF